jgi:hypothetical protein
VVGIEPVLRLTGETPTVNFIAQAEGVVHIDDQTPRHPICRTGFVTIKANILALIDYVSGYAGDASDESGGVGACGAISDY